MIYTCSEFQRPSVLESKSTYFRSMGVGRCWDVRGRFSTLSRAYFYSSRSLLRKISNPSRDFGLITCENKPSKAFPFAALTGELVSREAAVGHPRSSMPRQNRDGSEQARPTVERDKRTDSPGKYGGCDEAITGPLHPYDRRRPARMQMR